MKNPSYTKRLFRKFNQSEEGTLSVETVLVFPILLWAIVATIVFWDAFKSQYASQKANYAIADMMSREDGVAVTEDYLTAMHEVYRYISEDAAGTSSIRFTVVQRVLDDDGNPETLRIWSRGINELPDLDDLGPIEDRIPLMMTGDQLLVVETEHQWRPAFDVLIPGYQFRDVGIARPRFSPRLCLEDLPNPPICDPTSMPDPDIDTGDA